MNIVCFKIFTVDNYNYFGGIEGDLFKTLEFPDVFHIAILSF